MTAWQDIKLKKSDTIHQAISIIDKGSLQIAIVVNDENNLLGTITDGDVRRALLKGLSLNDDVSKIMNKNPITMPKTSCPLQIRQVMQDKNIHQMILTNGSAVHDVITIDSFSKTNRHGNKVVLMAGGLGTRLLPLTEHKPKPLVKVGKSPILETVIKNFKKQGFENITISVNYKGNMIKDFCGNGERFGVSINYIDEDKRLGTAGALSLIKNTPTEPIIIMNADILTRINFNHFIDFHNSNNAAASMAIREYSFEVPYGVVETEGSYLKEVVEKPQQHFFVNAGIYILNPEVIKLIPKDEFFDMPQLFNLLVEKEHKVAAFPIREYWIDIGQAQELEKANGDYKEMFAV